MLSAILPFVLPFSLVRAVLIATTDPVATPITRRQDSTHIPTFTVGLILAYFRAEIANPEPSGTASQIYPTGTYDELPEDGITVALGPGLRKQMEDTIAKGCSNNPTQDCRNKMTFIIQQTNVTVHIKRFLTFAWTAGIVIALIMAQLIVTPAMINNIKEPQEIKFNHQDLVQLNLMDGAQTFSVATEGSKATSTASYAVAAAATSSVPDYITIETMTKDENGHKAGDVVYRIPKHQAQRIRDYLGMTGLHETQEICKVQTSKRAETSEQCRQRIQQHAFDLIDGGPANMLQLAQRNIPARPGPGQAIGFPVENIAIEGAVIAIPVYRRIVSHAQGPEDNSVDPALVATSLAAVTIAAHVVWAVGLTLTEIWIRKDSLAKNLKEVDLACPKDLLCPSDDCKSQEEGERMRRDITPVCKETKYYGCRCNEVAYLHTMPLERGYMDLQYRWLEDLIKEADKHQYQPECGNGENKIANASTELNVAVINTCLDNPVITHSWNYDTDDKLFNLKFTKTEGVDCQFDCRAIFEMFSRNEKCANEDRVMKKGEIKMPCGTASYSAS